MPLTDAHPAAAPTSLPPPTPAPERAYPDWRKRLRGNLSRRSDGHWDPLTYVEAEGPAT